MTGATVKDTVDTCRDLQYSVDSIRRIALHTSRLITELDSRALDRHASEDLAAIQSMQGGIAALAEDVQRGLGGMEVTFNQRLGRAPRNRGQDSGESQPPLLGAPRGPASMSADPEGGHK